MYNTTEHIGETSNHDREMIEEYLQCVFSTEEEMREHCTIHATDSSYLIYLPEGIYKKKSIVINKKWLHINQKYEAKASKPIAFSELEYIDTAQEINITEDILSHLGTKSSMNQADDAVSSSHMFETEPAFWGFVYECVSILAKTIEQHRVSREAQAKLASNFLMQCSQPTKVIIDPIGDNNAGHTQQQPDTSASGATARAA